MRVLTQLKAVHAELREAIAGLEAVVSRPSPDRELLSAARLRLSKASSRRRSTLECSIYPILHDVPQHDAEKIANLRLEMATLMVQSSEHIGRWTVRAICEDWAGYQKASAAMRRSMLKRIEHEAAVLYPLLQAKLGQRAA
jgi:hypothetical protein